MKKRRIIGLLLLAAAGCGAAWYIRSYGLTLPQKITFPWGASWKLPEEVRIGSRTVTLPLRSDGEEEDSLYAFRVKDLSSGQTGAAEFFEGVVETQKTIEISEDSSRRLDQIFVETGDEIHKGDPLFSYDMADAQQKLEEARLEIAELDAILASQQQQLAALQEQRLKAKPEEFEAKDLEIAKMQNEIRRQNYNRSAKLVAEAELEKNLGDTVVFSQVDGVVSKVSKRSSGENDGMDYGMETGSDNGSGSLISIMKLGDYRIHATVDEDTIWGIYEGQEFQISPRADESTVWIGHVTEVHTEPDENKDDYYAEDSRQKYSFYLETDMPEDLVLGFHVTIKPAGQEDRKGVWIPEGFLVRDGEACSVWVSSFDERVHARPVEVGESDEGLGEIEIRSGLARTEYIVYPQEAVDEGVYAVHTSDTSLLYEILYPQEDWAEDSYEGSWLWEDWNGESGAWEDWGEEPGTWGDWDDGSGAWEDWGEEPGALEDWGEEPGTREDWDEEP